MILQLGAQVQGGGSTTSMVPHWGCYFATTLYWGTFGKILLQIRTFSKRMILCLRMDELLSL